MIGRARRTQFGLISAAIFWLAGAMSLQAQTPKAAAEQAGGGVVAAASRKAVGPRPSSELLGRSLGLSAGILALGGAVLLANRILVRRPPGRLTGQRTENVTDRGEVVQRIRLTGKQTLHVVQFGESVLLIGTGADDTPQLLTQWSAVAEPGELAGEASAMGVLPIRRAEEPAA
ncbi:MAG: flagellar biosynthetic protein FliO [Isosphaeraceae bacterium]